MTKVKESLSSQVRAIALEKYVKPALRGGKSKVSIRVRDVAEDLRAKGFPENHVPQICSALQALKFQKENGLRIESIVGPPSKMSTTVVINYSLEKAAGRSGLLQSEAAQPRMSPAEAKAKAKRLTDKIRGILREELAAYGGGEAFIRWVRGENEE